MQTAQLTKRQTRIRDLLKKGLRPYQIARRLRVNTRLVERAKERIRADEAKANRTHFSQYAPSIWCK